MDAPDHVILAGKKISVIWLADGVLGEELRGRLTAGGITSPAPAVAVVGGAGGLAPADAITCESAFAQALLPAVIDAGATIVDGGTDAGIMRLLGRVRREAGAGVQQIGVVAGGTVAWPGQSPADGTAQLERNHTHFVVVPGVAWGDEVPWLHAVTAAIAGELPRITVLANGGEIAYWDVAAAVATRHRVFVLSGTGRAADEIARAAATDSGSPMALTIARSPLVTVLPDEVDAIVDAIGSALRG